MKCTFRTKWEDGQIVCVCTLSNKCTHARSCEELDFKLNKFEGLNECMKQRSYKRGRTGIRQVKHE